MNIYNYTNKNTAITFFLFNSESLLCDNNTSVQFCITDLLDACSFA